MTAPRTAGDIGELEWIRRIARMARRAGGGRGVALGIGDDAALLRARPGEDIATSCDARVQGVHFRFDWESPRGAGRRALVAGLSDLAAMGARPLGFTLALAAPSAAPLPQLMGLLRGLLDVAQAARCPLVGGNLSRAAEISLTLGCLGAQRRGRALRRDAGRPGDGVFVTGALGRAALERARERVRYVPPLRLAAGRALARLAGAGACVDLSDGLLADLGHLCRSSGVGAALDCAALPLPPRFAAAARRAGCNALHLALCGGEDYELLFTLRPGAAAKPAALSRRLGAPVAQIGTLRKAPGIRLQNAPAGWRNGRSECNGHGRAGGRGAALHPGWRHFQPEAA